MAIEVVTKEDLQEFRIKLLDDIRQLMIPPETRPVKPWLKNAEVKMLLNISANTLHRLRVGGKLRSSKVGGIHYYQYKDIEQLLNAEKAGEWKR